MLLKILLLCLSLTIANVAVAKIHTYQLDNGLKVLVKQDRRAPVATIQVWYKVGSSYENMGITGVSHALEHMMFKGTHKYPGDLFSRIISENGGQDNAFTGRDYTTYFQLLEKSRVEISFQLESDRMHNLNLMPSEFLKEIEVVKEERRYRTEDNPQAFLYESMLAAAYQTSPYRFPVIGWMQDINNMTVADLQDWYQKWYAPNNATLVVVGDVKPQQIYDLAKKYFGPLPKGAPIQFKTVKENEQLGMKRIAVTRPAKIPYLIMAYKAPVITADKTVDKDWEPYALEVLAEILSGGRSARLESRLVRGSQVAAAAAVSYQAAARLDNLFVLSGTPSQGKVVKDLERAFRKEVIDLKTNLVTEAELKRVKAQVISSDVYEKDSIFYQAYIMGMLETIGLSPALADEYVMHINNITAEQVMAVAKKYLVDDSLTIAELVLPAPKEPVTELTGD